MSNILKYYASAYYAGDPLIDDKTYDYLEDKYGRNSVGAKDGEIKHYKPMYSLDKVYVGEKLKLQEHKLVETPKLDGLAISLLYDQGILVRALTRGDGIQGQDVTDKALVLMSIPPQINCTDDIVQITGEIVCPKDTENARNFASGAMNLKDMTNFATRADSLFFVAYSTSDNEATYSEDMRYLRSEGFDTVLSEGLEELYRTDGRVFRVDNNVDFEELGYTAKAPRGAFALR